MLRRTTWPRICLLASGTTQHPHAQGVVAALLQERRQHLALQDLEGVRVAEEAGDADEDVRIERVELVVIPAEKLGVTFSRVVLGEDQTTRDAALDGVRLVQREIDAGVVAKQEQDLLESFFLAPIAGLLDTAAASLGAGLRGAGVRSAVCPGRERRVIVFVRGRRCAIAFCAGKWIGLRTAGDMWMPGDARDLVGDLFRREHGVHAAGGNGAARHRVVARGLVLRERNATLSLDRLQAQRAIRRRTGENDADRQSALIRCQRLEKKVDRPMRRARVGARTQRQNAAINAKVRVGRNHVDVIRLHGEPVRHILDRHRRGAAQQLGKRTLMLRIEVLNQHEAHAGVDWQARKQRRERLKPAGGRADAHNRKRGARSRLRLDRRLRRDALGA